MTDLKSLFIACAMSTRLRRWTWTLNNPTDAEKDHIKNLEVGPASGLRYLCYGEEEGELGTPHLQGYVEFFSGWSWNRVKQLISGRLHVEASQGSPLQNLKYCSKTRECDNISNSVFVEIGEISSKTQGKRKDILEVKEMVDDGCTDLEISQAYFGTWIRNRDGIKEYRSMITRPREIPDYSLNQFPQHWIHLIPSTWNFSIILWGEAGLGKTEFAKTILGEGYLMVSHMDDLRDYDPNFHSGILFDDMDFKHTPRHSQIHLIDWDNNRSIHARYRVARIPKHTKKIFTTNETNGNIFSDMHSDRAITRRLKIIELKE